MVSGNKRWAAIAISFTSLFSSQLLQAQGLGETRIPNTDLVITDIATQLPNQLSEFPALLTAGSGNGELIDGVIPYKPSSILWSDNARKERYLALPGMAQVGLTQSGGWNMPEGAILVKNFSLPLDERTPDAALKRIETRVMILENGTWQGFTYEWNEEETDATLVARQGASREIEIIDQAGDLLNVVWDYPSRGQCFACHTDAANTVLGVTTAALNSDFHYPTSGITQNQIEAMNYISIFDAPVPESLDDLPKMPDYSDENETLFRRAKAYFASNCSMCHQPNGGTPVDMDLRWESTLTEMTMLNISPYRSTLGLSDPKRIDPSNPDNSIAVLRMEDREGGNIQMPIIGSNRVDEEGVQIIRDWVSSMGSPDLFVIH